MPHQPKDKSYKDYLEQELTSQKGVSETGVEVRRADARQKGAIAHGYARSSSGPDLHRKRAISAIKSKIEHLKRLPKPDLTKGKLTPRVVTEPPFESNRVDYSPPYMMVENEVVDGDVYFRNNKEKIKTKALRKDVARLGFPKVGITRTDQEVQPISTPRQAKIAAKVVSQALKRAMTNKTNLPTEKEISDSLIEPTAITHLMTGKDKGVTVSVKPNPATVADSRSFYNPIADDGLTQEHEAIHLAFNKLAQKHGLSFSNQVRGFLLQNIHPDDRDVLRSYIQSTGGYDHHQLDGETLPHLYQILSDPNEQKKFGDHVRFNNMQHGGGLDTDLPHASKLAAGGDVRRMRKAWGKIVKQAKYILPPTSSTEIA